MDGGDVFTLHAYAPEASSGASDASGDGNRYALPCQILMQYEAPSSSARLGRFVWRRLGAGAVEASASASGAPLHGSLPVHLISDVFLGMQSACFLRSISSGSVGGPGSPSDEDSCFTLSSRACSLDLEGATPADTHDWLRRLSNIINESGKDIVLAAQPDQPHPLHHARVDPLFAPTAAAPAAAVIAMPASPTQTETETEVESHWKVRMAEAEARPAPTDQADLNAATVVAEMEEAESKASTAVSAAAAVPAAPASPHSDAHGLLVSGVGFPFWFHYLSLATGRLCSARVLLSFVAARRDKGAGDDEGGGGGGTFVLRTESSSERPSIPHRCLGDPSPVSSSSSSPPLSSIGSQADLPCVWESCIEMQGLCDVYVGSTKGLFASQEPLANRDASRCVTLVSDDPPPGFSWNLEAHSSDAFVHWLDAFNAILQGLEREVAVAIEDEKSATAEQSLVAPAATAGTSALDQLRCGAYFSLYQAAPAPASADGATSASADESPIAIAAAPSKKLILMFYNDSSSRPLHPTEQLLLASDSFGPDASLARCSLFYRYVPAALERPPVSPQPLPTDNCVPVVCVSDLLLGRQTALMCNNPMASLASNDHCFSLIVCGPAASAAAAAAASSAPTASSHTTELGLECLQDKQMALWLEGIMEVSNRSSGGGDSGADPDPAATTTPASATGTALSTPNPRAHSQLQLHKPAPLQLPATPAGYTITTFPYSSSIGAAAAPSSSTSALAPSASTSPAPDPAPASTAATAAESRLLSIEHVVSSPQLDLLAATDPSVQLLQRGSFFHAWDNYERPRRRRVFLFWAPSHPLDSASDPHAAAAPSPLPSNNRGAGGTFYWNYAPLHEEDGREGAKATGANASATSAAVAAAAAAGSQLPAPSSPLWTKSAHRSLALDAISSVYLGTIASIFRRTPSSGVTSPPAPPPPPPTNVLSILTDDDLLNLECDDAQSRAGFVAALRRVMRANLARNLIRVEFDHATDAIDAQGADAAAGAGVAGTTVAAQQGPHVNEWFNVQEAVFPLQLAGAPALPPAQTEASTSSPPASHPPSSRASFSRPVPAQMHALHELAQGMEFESWSFAPDAAAASVAAAPPSSRAVQIRPITLFFQQTIEDYVIFFVWVERSEQGAATTATAPAQDARQLRRARAWARSIRHSRDLAHGISSSSSSSSSSFPSLPVSAICDLHIGKNLPIFSSPSTASNSRALLADECVSLVASSSSSTEPSAPAAAGTPPVELHLVATRGIAQVASVISAVTTLLELDGARLDQPLWDLLHPEEEGADASPAVDPSSKPSPVPAAASSSTPAPVQIDASRLAPLRRGSIFWMWKFASPDGVSGPSSPRRVVRRQVLLRWLPNTELGELHWQSLGGTPAESGVMDVACITDFLLSAEAAPFAPDYIVSSCDPRTGRMDGSGAHRVANDQNCFSILSCPIQGGDACGAELHLETDASLPADETEVDAWVDGLSMLLQSGGRSLTEEAGPDSAGSGGAPIAPELTLLPVQPAEAPTGVRVHLGFDVSGDDGDGEGRGALPSATPASPATPVYLDAEPATPAPAAASPTAVLPPVSSPPSLDEILALVRTLHGAGSSDQGPAALSRYTEAQLELALAHIRDAAASQPLEWTDAMMSAGAARVVVQCMQAYPWSESVQQSGAGACWCLATNAENEALLVAAGALHLNRTSLSRFPHNAMLLQQACGAVRNLTVADAHKQMFCSGGTSPNADGVAASDAPTALDSCRALVAALRTHVSGGALAQQASGSIASLAMHPSNKSLLGESGAVEALVGAMSAHPGNDDAAAQVHEECCAALRNLAANHAENKGVIARCGGVDAIVRSMRTHIHSSVNQLHGAGALWNVPANSAPNKALVAACGGIHAILDAVIQHPDDAEVQLECVGALRNLSTLAQNKPILLGQGQGRGQNAVPVVLATMRRLIDAPLLQEQACALLFNLANAPAAASNTAVASLLQHDAPATLAAVLDAHLAVFSVVEEAAAALWILHRAAPGAAWDPALVSRVLRLADRAMAAHGAQPDVLNFVAGMKAAWGTVAPSPMQTPRATQSSTSSPTAAAAAVLANGRMPATLQPYGSLMPSHSRQPSAVAERF